jgi:TRAP-type C4-dicarboxylate transport system permease small subunit
MGVFERFLRRAGFFSVLIGGASFLAAMILITLNVIARMVKLPIRDSYATSELIMMAGGAYALFYAALQEANIEITVLSSRLPKQTKTILQIFSSFLSMVFWTLICWQSIGLALQRGFSECTDILKVPVLPSRIIWIIGLVFLVLLHFRNIIKKGKGIKFNDTN